MSMDAPYGAALAQGRGMTMFGACCAPCRCLCARAWSDPHVCAGAWCCRSHGALVARSLRGCSLRSQPPGGEGLRAPTPGPPTRGKLSLQAFARCARLLRFAQGVSVLAHGATRRVRAGGALPPRRSLCSQPPRAGAARPYPRTPTCGKLSLQAFARCRARAALRAGVSVLAHGATRVMYPGACCYPPVCRLVLSLEQGRIRSRRLFWWLV